MNLRIQTGYSSSLPRIPSMVFVTPKYAPGSVFFGRKVQDQTEAPKYAPGSVFFGREVQDQTEAPECLDKVALITKLKERLVVRDNVMKDTEKKIRRRHNRLQRHKKFGRSNEHLLELCRLNVQKDLNDRLFSNCMREQSLCIEAEIFSLECLA